MVIILIFGGEHHASMVAHGIGQVSRQMSQTDSVMRCRSIQSEHVLDESSLILPVLQLNAENVVPFSDDGVDLGQAKPEFICNALTAMFILCTCKHVLR